MLKKIRYGIVVFGLLLSFFTAAANATNLVCLKSSKTGGALVRSSICDVTFSTIPIFACGGVFPQTGVFTLHNNTPVSMKINYVRIQNNDRNSGTVTITGNTCGSSLAANGSCNITVSLSSAGPFSRILQVGIDSRQVELDSPVITPTTNCNVATTPSTAFTNLCSLGSTSSFATLAGSTITNTGPTVLNGNLGLYPGTSVTGFPPGVVNGSQFIADSTALTAQNDLTTLYNCLAAQPCTTVIGTADQAGVTLTGVAGAANVYCSGSSILNSGVLTLNGNGNANTVFIFQAGSTLTLNPTASIVLTNGAQAQNVFWQVGSSATLGTTSIFNGTITAFSSITLNTGAVVTGRALARNAAVTFQTNTVSLP